MNRKATDMFRVWRRSEAGRLVAMCLVLIGCGTLAAGCAGAAKPGIAATGGDTAANPMETFNGICNHALGEDLTYVRSHLSPDLIKQLCGAQTGPAADKPIQDLMRELSVCRACSCKKTPQADKVTLRVARALSGGVRLFDMDMARDPQRGWVLASKLYNEGPIEKSEGASK